MPVGPFNKMPKFPIDVVRKAFPALKRAGDFIFFDNAAGAQAPNIVLDAVTEHLLLRNVQRGGPYRQSLEVDAVVARARESVAALVNAHQPEEICFGMNATSFIWQISLAIGQTLRKKSGTVAQRREVIVTDLDHEANIATWMALKREGAEIVVWKMRRDGRLHPEDLDARLSRKTRLVACPMASNALGSVVDIAGVAQRAHAVGAEVFVDAVHYGPHGTIDVQKAGCDYLVCSGYKIFAPHMGFLWGRKELLDALPTFREDFIPDVAPGKFEIGTFIYENVAGMDAAVSYLEDLGRKLSPQGKSLTRRAALVSAMDGIREYEAILSAEFLKLLAAIKGVVLYGVTSDAMVGQRTPTFCFNVNGRAPKLVAETLARQGFGIRSGHMYAPRLMRRLRLSLDTGAVRASLVHYNAVEEIQRFGSALSQLS